jgi:hypothetical protein
MTQAICGTTAIELVALLNQFKGRTVPSLWIGGDNVQMASNKGKTLLITSSWIADQDVAAPLAVTRCFKNKGTSVLCLCWKVRASSLILFFTYRERLKNVENMLDSQVFLRNQVGWVVLQLFSLTNKLPKESKELCLV